MNLEALKAHNEELKDDQLFDYMNRTYRPTEDGEYYLRVIPEKDEDLFFHADGYHILDGDFYQDCHDPSECPICNKIRQFEKSGSNILKEEAKRIKRNKRFTYQVVLLDREGMIADPIPKLMTVSPSLHRTVVSQIINIGEDAIDLKKGRNFILIRKTGEKYVDYSESHFSSLSTELDISQVDTLNKLTDGKYYNYSRAEEHLDELDKLERLHMENHSVDDFDRELKDIF